MNSLLVNLSAICCLVVLLTSQGAMASLFNTDDETFNFDQVTRDRRLQLLRLDDVGARQREQTVTYAGLAYCPDNVNATKHGNETDDDAIPRIATCPWFWTLNFDPQRDPSTLLTATCSPCNGACLNATGLGRGKGRCVPVHYYRDVTYNVTDVTSQAPKLVRKLYRIAVGCTCERIAKI